MADRSSTVAFFADVTNYVKGMDTAAGKTKSFTQKVEGASRKASLVLGALAGAGALFVKSAVEDEAAASKLAQTIQKVTGATETQTAAVEDYITKTALAVGVADDDLRPSLAKLVTATKSVTDAQKLQALALDISAATGKDLSAVTDGLVKAQNGSLGGLKKLGVPLDENILKTKNFKAAQEELAKTFGGAAKKAAETNSGVMKRNSIAIAEAQESIGALLLPAVGALAKEFQKLAPFIDENRDTIVKIVAVVATFAAAIVGLNFGLKAYAAAVKAWSAATKIATAIQAAFNFVMAMNPITLVVIAIVALIAILVLAYKKFDGFREIVDTAFETLKNAAMTAFNWLKENWPTVLAIITGPFGLAVLAIVKNWDKITGFFKELPGKLAPLIKGVVNVLTTPFRTAFSFIAKIWNNTVGKLSFELPDWVPGLGGKGFSMPKLPETIPALAAGGVVTKPTLALIGEAGPEAVIPLNRAGGTGVTNIYVTGTLMDPEGTVRAIKQAFVNSELRAGAY